MNLRIISFLSALLVAMGTLAGVQAVRADKLILKDGTQIEGTIRNIEKGQVTLAVGAETKVFDVLGITKVEFDMPSLEEGTARLPVEHFRAGMESQEMLGHVKNVEDSAGEVRKLIDHTQKEWAGRKSLEPGQEKEWGAAKERLLPALSRYQEALDDLYFHVLGKVDEYNRLMKQADAIYVGVKGWFNVGSSLIPKGMEKLPLKKYVPANWRDTIYYEGYNRGYNEAYEKYSTTFHEPYEAPPAQPGMD